MLRYKRLVVSGTANTEVTAELLVGTDQEPKKLVALWFREITGTRNNDAQLVGYVESLKVLEHDVRVFLDGAATPLYSTPPRLALGVDLPAGSAFDVGCISGATASDFVFVAEYEVTKR